MLMNKYVFLFTVLAFIYGCQYISVDKCLDNGGRWNYENDSCEMKKSVAEPTDKEN